MDPQYKSLYNLMLRRGYSIAAGGLRERWARYSERTKAGIMAAWRHRLDTGKAPIIDCP